MLNHGDALSVCANWHNATYSKWMKAEEYSYLLRGNGGIFSYENSYYFSVYNNRPGTYLWDAYYTHAIAVCGEDM